MPALVRNAVRFAFGKSKSQDGRHHHHSHSHSFFRHHHHPLSSTTSSVASTVSTASSSTASPPNSLRKLHVLRQCDSETETESDPEPLPPCACDAFYIDRCEYHVGEHHGLSFELASDFVDLQHLLRTIRDQEKRRFVYKDTQVGKLIEFLALQRFPLTATQLSAVTTLLRERLTHITGLQLVDAIDAPFVQRHRAAFRQLLATAFAVPPRVKFNSLAATSLPSDEIHGHLQAFTVRECPMDNTFFAAVGSALHYSTAVTKLDLQQLLVPERIAKHDRTLCWAWLAFGLFHPNSTAKITDLDLSRNMLRMEDVRMIEGVMSGGHAAHVLLIPEYTAALRKYSTSPQDAVLRDDIKRILIKSIPKRRLFALIKPHATLWPLPTAHVRPHSVATDVLVDSELLEVFCLLNKWLCVVVPGFGLAWLPRTSVVELTEIAMSPRVCSPASLLRSAAFANMIEAHEAEGMAVPLVTLFCQMAGVSEHLETLSLSGNRIGTPESFGIPAHEILHRVLHSSPYLTALDLSHCQLTDASALVSAYERGDCRIQSLNLDSNQLGLGNGAFDLAMLLAHDSGDAARTGTWLTSLSLLFNSIDDIGMRALLAALEHNVHLEHLAIEYGNTFPSELGDVEFAGDDAQSWHTSGLFERLAVLRVLEERLPSDNNCIDNQVLETMWEFLGYY